MHGLWLRIGELVWKKFLEDKENDALGLHKLNHVVEHEATPSILGMVNKVKHLVCVVK